MSVGRAARPCLPGRREGGLSARLLARPGLRLRRPRGPGPPAAGPGSQLPRPWRGAAGEEAEERGRAGGRAPGGPVSPPRGASAPERSGPPQRAPGNAPPRALTRVLAGSSGRAARAVGNVRPAGRGPPRAGRVLAALPAPREGRGPRSRPAGRRCARGPGGVSSGAFPRAGPALPGSCRPVDVLSPCRWGGRPPATVATGRLACGRGDRKTKFQILLNVCKLKCENPARPAAAVCDEET